MQTPARPLIKRSNQSSGTRTSFCRFPNLQSSATSQAHRPHGIGIVVWQRRPQCERSRAFLQLISGIFFLFTILAKLENKTITTKCVYNLVVSQNPHFIIRLKNVKNSVILGLAELVIPELWFAGFVRFYFIYFGGPQKHQSAEVVLTRKRTQTNFGECFGTEKKIS